MTVPLLVIVTKLSPRSALGHACLTPHLSPTEAAHALQRSKPLVWEMLAIPGVSTSGSRSSSLLSERVFVLWVISCRWFMGVLPHPVQFFYNWSRLLLKAICIRSRHLAASTENRACMVPLGGNTVTLTEGTWRSKAVKGSTSERRENGETEGRKASRPISGKFYLRLPSSCSFKRGKLPWVLLIWYEIEIPPIGESCKVWHWPQLALRSGQHVPLVRVKVPATQASLKFMWKVHRFEIWILALSLEAFLAWPGRDIFHKFQVDQTVMPSHISNLWGESSIKQRILSKFICSVNLDFHLPDFLKGIHLWPEVEPWK